MMVRCLPLFAALLVLAVGSPNAPSHASACAVDEYDHNGSTMEYQVCDGGEISISYVRPRSGLRPHGVREGTLLFNGSENRNGRITGQARIFNNHCGEITYSVSGTSQGGSIVLNGQAPVRNKSCRVTRYRPDRLLFTLLGGAPVKDLGGGAGTGNGTQTPVAPTCPAGYSLQGGQCIRDVATAPAPTCPTGYSYIRGRCVQNASVPQQDNGAQRLANAIAGTKWWYHWSGSRDHFPFGRNGMMEGPWKGVPWVAKDANTVHLQGADGGVMVLRFTGTHRFDTHDWDGTPAWGVRQ